MKFKYLPAQIVEFNNRKITDECMILTCMFSLGNRISYIVEYYTNMNGKLDCKTMEVLECELGELK